MLFKTHNGKRSIRSYFAHPHIPQGKKKLPRQKPRQPAILRYSSSSSNENSSNSPHLSQRMLPLSRVSSSKSMMLPQAHSTS